MAQAIVVTPHLCPGSTHPREAQACNCLGKRRAQKDLYYNNLVSPQ